MRLRTLAVQWMLCKTDLPPAARFAAAFALLWLAAAPLSAQRLSVGVKAGVPLTDAFKHGLSAPVSPATYTSATRRYVLGPSAELMLPMGIGIQLDALYRRVGFEASSPVTAGTLFREVRGNSWEFPLMLKVRSPGILFRPFVQGGVTFQTLSGLKQFVQDPLGSRDEDDDPPELQDRNNRGFIIGAGFDIKAPIVRISPEFRFTRWADENFLSTLNLLRTNKNQADFIIGFNF